MSTIRLLFVVPDLRVGGAERQLTTLLSKMDREKFASSVVCIGDEGGLFESLQRIGIEGQALRLSGRRNVLKALSRLMQIMREVRPEVVVLRGFNAEILGRIAARMTGVRRVILWVHNYGDVHRRKGLRVLADRLLDCATDCYFGVAETQRHYMVNELRYPDRKVRIIQNGVDPTAFSVSNDRSVLAELSIAQTAPVVGIVAALRPEKDHATLLRAASIVVNRMSDAAFVIVGDGPVRPELEALCRELGLTNNVQFLGTRKDINRLLGSLDVFTLCSNTVECFPMALLEAMACAKPAVCTNVGGVGEIVSHGESGYLVPPNDPRQLAARLIELLSDANLARTMGRAGRRRVEQQFSLARSASATERAIRDVVLSIPADR